MTEYAFDHMDDFFDFDQLERDHVCSGTSGPTPCGLPDDVTVMDWSAGGPHQPDIQLDHLPESGDSSNGHSYGSNTGELDHLISVSDIYTGHTTATGLAIADHSHLPSTAPSSSFLPGQHLGLIGGAIMDSVIGSLELLPWIPLSEPPHHSQADAPSSLEENNLPPVRQSPTSAWKAASAKRKGPQSRIPLEAKQILEDEFAANAYPCSWEIDIIAHQANLEVKKVRNWFNNTRARKKGEGKFLCSVIANVYAYSHRPSSCCQDLAL
jgi:hypothetical protein